MAKIKVGDCVKIHGVILGRVVAVDDEAMYDVKIDDVTGTVRTLPETALEEVVIAKTAG